MASTSQHRCVFVGNIPYDATEEQLIQICEEVGPVVSFRLVTDRETGKPKGYGFCEYKDEETALSARRNLLGYEINGRQLRVDFAENDKGSDRNREQVQLKERENKSNQNVKIEWDLPWDKLCFNEGFIRRALLRIELNRVVEEFNVQRRVQGRGGPGMTANADPQKQVGGPAILGDSAHQQPIGLSLATAAASIMAGTLGGAQVGSKANPSGLYSQAGLGGDPLTLHLAKMSRSQLNEIFSELKAMATEDKELARQLLLANPQLPKALFQAQIMLGTVTPEMLQMPNIRQGGSLLQPLSQDAQQSRLPAFQAPIAQNKMQFGMIPKVQEGQASAMRQSSLVTNQVSAVPQLQTLSRAQMPHVAPTQVQQPSFPAHSGVSTLPSIAPKPLSDLTARPQIHVATSSSSNQKMQVPLLQHSGRYETANTGHNRQVVNPNVTVPPFLTRPPVSDPRFQTQPCSSMMSNSSLDATLGRPSKLIKLDEERNIPLPLTGLNGPTTSGSGPSRVIGLGSSPANQIPKAQNQQSEQQVSQLQLPPEVESALLQQVMNLTPEQLSLLPPEQQQQVIQLQQMLR